MEIHDLETQLTTTDSLVFVHNFKKKIPKTKQQNHSNSSFYIFFFLKNTSGGKKITSSFKQYDFSPKSSLEISLSEHTTCKAKFTCRT